MNDAAKSAGVPVRFNRCGSMFCAYFTDAPVRNLADAMKSTESVSRDISTACWTRAFIWRRRNSRLASSRPRTAEADIEKTVQTAAEVMRRL